MCFGSDIVGNGKASVVDADNVRNHRAATSDCLCEYVRLRGSGALHCYAAVAGLSVVHPEQVGFTMQTAEMIYRRLPTGLIVLGKFGKPFAIDTML